MDHRRRPSAAHRLRRLVVERDDQPVGDVGAGEAVDERAVLVAYLSFSRRVPGRRKASRTLRSATVTLPPRFVALRMEYETKGRSYNTYATYDSPDGLHWRRRDNNASSPGPIRAPGLGLSLEILRGLRER